MKKTIATALLFLVSGLAANTTALAEPFNHGSSYTNAISNANVDARAQSTQSSVRHFESMATISGFNDRSTVENEEVTVSPRTVVETAISKMFSALIGGFNDRS
ncbi:MAG TPA: hypothetical protein PKY50_15800 [Candidatus Competibacter sp.]|nr:hypothetical protein [Candidatus Competibacter sp.]